MWASQRAFRYSAPEIMGSHNTNVSILSARFAATRRQSAAQPHADEYHSVTAGDMRQFVDRRLDIPTPSLQVSFDCFASRITGSKIIKAEAVNSSRHQHLAQSPQRSISQDVFRAPWITKYHRAQLVRHRPTWFINSKKLPWRLAEKKGFISSARLAGHSCQAQTTSLLLSFRFLRLSDAGSGRRAYGDPSGSLYSSSRLRSPAPTSANYPRVRRNCPRA